MKNRDESVLYVVGILLLFFMLVMFFFGTGAAYAAPLIPPERQTECSPNQFDQRDMAGTYEATWMLVQIFPCGPIGVVWTNLYGEHVALYMGVDRIPKEGLIAYGYSPDPRIDAYLDSTPMLGIKAAEPGWIQVATFNEDSKVVQQYRLRKTK